MRSLPLTLLLAAFALPAPGLLGQESGQHAAPPPIYDEDADAAAATRSAVATAAHKNKRVLVMWGGNWCGWCHKLHDLLGKDATLRRELLYEYVLVMVDSNGNAALAAELGADLGQGVPFLTVLDGAGRPLAQQETGALEVGDRHDPAKVLAFLKAHEAAPQDASAVYAAARARAAREQKRVLVRFGAPW